jgi:hypothetical protein
MPIGKSRIGHRVESFRFQGIRDVEDDPVARAGAGRQLARWKDGDVVALVGLAGLLGAFPVLATLPQPGQASAGFVREDGGAGSDA